MYSNLPSEVRHALMALDEPERPALLTTDLLNELARRLLIHYHPASGAATFTESGKQAYLELTGFFPTHNV
jgi:hypothetical protein